MGRKGEFERTVQSLLTTLATQDLEPGNCGQCASGWRKKPTSGSIGSSDRSSPVHASVVTWKESTFLASSAGAGGDFPIRYSGRRSRAKSSHALIAAFSLAIKAHPSVQLRGSSCCTRRASVPRHSASHALGRYWRRGGRAQFRLAAMAASVSCLASVGPWQARAMISVALRATGAACTAERARRAARDRNGDRDARMEDAAWRGGARDDKL